MFQLWFIINLILPSSFCFTNVSYFFYYFSLDPSFCNDVPDEKINNKRVFQNKNQIRKLGSADRRQRVRDKYIYTVSTLASFPSSASTSVMVPDLSSCFQHTLSPVKTLNVHKGLVTQIILSSSFSTSSRSVGCLCLRAEIWTRHQPRPEVEVVRDVGYTISSCESAFRSSQSPHNTNTIKNQTIYIHINTQLEISSFPAKTNWI